MSISRNILKLILTGRKPGYQRAIEKYTNSMITEKTDSEHFLRTTPYLLTKAAGLNNATIAIFDRAADCYHMYCAGTEIERLTDETRSVLIRELKKKRTEIKLSETENTQIMEKTRELCARLIIPGFSPDGELTLILCLGQRKSGEGYSRADIRYFRALTNKILAYVAAA